jgi:glyoxylase-like metal-dependent hydrolase (beta-lactamase superfamily II)
MGKMLDELTEIVPGLYLLEAPERGRFPYCNSLIVGRGQELLIDAGYGLDRRLAAHGWRPERVAVSHAHPDHVASLWAFADAELWSPVQRSEIFWRYEPMGRRFGGEKFAELWISGVKELGIQEVAADHHFDDGHVFDTGDVRLHCIHSPGHVDDHYVFFEPHHGVVFTCDIDLTRVGPWYAQTEGNIELFLESIDRVAALEPRVLVSSHKKIMTDDIPGRLRRYADIIRQRDDTLVSLLKAPASLERLIDANPFFGDLSRSDDLFRFWEGNMIAKHLDRLAAAGAVREEGGLWHRV